MAKPFKVEIVGNVKGLLSATKQSEEALEVMSDALDAVADGSIDVEQRMTKAFKGSAREADSSGEKIEKSLKEVDKQAEKSAEKTEDSFSDAFKKVTADSRKAADNVNDEQQRMSEITEEVGSEMAQNFGSTMASFDGSAQSAVDIIADSFGGLAASMGIGGPIGTLILGAAAGVVSYFGTAWVEEFENIKAKQAEMYEQMLANTNAYFNDEQIAEAFNKIMSGAEDALIDEDTLNRYVEATKMSAQDIAYAFADSRSQQAEQLSGILLTAENKYQAEIEKISNFGTRNATAFQQAERKAGYSKDLVDRFRELRRQVEETSDAVVSNSEYLAAQGHMAQDSAQKISDYLKAQADIDAAIKDANEAISTNLAAHEDANEAYEQNLGVLADLADALKGEQEAAEAAGIEAEDLTTLQYEQAEAFLEASRKAKLSSDEAADLAHELGLIPKSVATDIKTKGVAQAIRDAQNFKKTTDQQPKSIVTQLRVKSNPAQANEEISFLERQLRNITVIGNVKLNRTAL